MKMNPKSIIDERIKVVREKLMFDLKTKKSKMKIEKGSDRGHQEKDEEQLVGQYVFGRVSVESGLYPMKPIPPETRKSFYSSARVHPSDCFNPCLSV